MPKHHTYLFDTTLAATIRIVAEDENTARAALNLMTVGAHVKLTDARGHEVEFSATLISVDSVRQQS